MKRKRIAVALFSLILFAGSMQAQSNQPVSSGEQIQLTWSIFDVKSGASQRPKAPIAPHYVYLDQGVLSIGTNFDGYTLELYQDGELTYQHFILDGECSIELPSIFSGNYVIRFVNAEGNAYVGVITL